MEKFFVPVLLGTAREERQSENVAKFVHAQAEAFEFETELVDVRDHLALATVPSWVDNPKAEKWKSTMERADGLIVVSPEYNHGYPGELKMMLDTIYQEYFGKPLGIAGVSAGVLGGARMVEQLRQVSIELHMFPVREALYFSGVKSLFDESGNIQDDAFSERAKKLFEEMKGYMEKLRG